MAKLLRQFETKTSNGYLSKGWYQIDNNTVLVKGNSAGLSDSYGYEPFSEALAYRLGRLLGLPVIPYFLAPAADFKEIRTFCCDYVSVCAQIPLKNDEQMLHFAEYADILLGKPVTDYYNFYKKSELSNDFLCKMLLFDAVTGNSDRHLNNFDVIINGKGTVKNAPVIDNGASMLSLIPNRKLKLYTGIGPDAAKPFKDTHDKQIRLLRHDFHMRTTAADNIFELWDRDCSDIFALMHPFRATAIRHYIKKRLNYYGTMQI